MSSISAQWVEVLQVACEVIVSDSDRGLGFEQSDELLMDLFAGLRQREASV
jgi:hypothetical protein